MDKKYFMVNVIKGTIRSLLITVVMIIIYSVLMNFIDVSGKVNSVVYLIITCLSIVFGAIYVAKANEKKGWISGVMLALVYMILIMLISGTMRGFSEIMDIYALYRMIIALAVGALSGMLGINI
ncbi:TIGR04086 family membrane protein [Clostridium sp. MSJ-4]|uniref:TIGR04086 family membrane protein n=1 Tax=Clostridium simiarum TaxID=2841506 RepID=A0ABS6F060_9CLOT|nr:MULTISPECIES: TIGR04086 family membrane protein [Clostridium]MBU5590977.1 TIGR04086 family membrane protein [Clostridium simiarum]